MHDESVVREDSYAYSRQAKRRAMKRLDSTSDKTATALAQRGEKTV